MTIVKKCILYHLVSNGSQLLLLFREKTLLENPKRGNDTRLYRPFALKQKRYKNHYRFKLDGVTFAVDPGY